MPDPNKLGSPPYALLRIDDDGHMALVGTANSYNALPLQGSFDHFSSAAVASLTDSLLVVLWYTTEIEISAFGVQVDYVQELVDIYQTASALFYGSPLIDFQAWSDEIHNYNRDLLDRGWMLCGTGQCAEGRHLLDHVIRIADMMLDSPLAAQADSVKSNCMDPTVDVQVLFPGRCAIPAYGDTGTVRVTVYQSDGTPGVDVPVSIWLEGAGSIASTGGLTDTNGVWTTTYIAPDQPPAEVPKIHAQIDGACDPTVEWVGSVGGTNMGVPGVLSFTLLQASVAVYICCDKDDNETAIVHTVVNDTTALDRCVPDIGNGGWFGLRAGGSSPYGSGSGGLGAGIEGASFFTSGPGQTHPGISNGTTITSRLRGVLKFRRADGSAFSPGTVIQLTRTVSFNGSVQFYSNVATDSSWSDGNTNPPVFYYRLAQWTPEVWFTVWGQSADHGFAVGATIKEGTGQ